MLQDKLDQLRCECECLRGRERAHELEWQRDADARHQAALAPLRHAAADAASLRTVLDLRTADVHELRRECADLLKRVGGWAHGRKVDKNPGLGDKFLTVSDSRLRDYLSGVKYLCHLFLI